MICAVCNGNGFIRESDDTVSSCTACTGTADRDRVIAEAAKLITEERADAYGSADDNFSRIADLWSVVFQRQVTISEVALAMALVKVARLVHDNKHRDSWRDAIGYMALGCEVSNAS